MKRTPVLNAASQIEIEQGHFAGRELLVEVYYGRDSFVLTAAHCGMERCPLITVPLVQLGSVEHDELHEVRRLLRVFRKYVHDQVQRRISVGVLPRQISLLIYELLHN